MANAKLETGSEADPPTASEDQEKMDEDDGQITESSYKKVLRKKLNLRCHIKNYNADETTEGEDMEVDGVECSVCDKVLSSRVTLRRHMKRCHPKKAKQDDHEQTDGESVKCSSCDKIFSSGRSLKCHIKKYHVNETSDEGKKDDDDSEDVECSFCDNIFSSRRNLRCHVKKYHSNGTTEADQSKKKQDVQTIQCPSCDKVFGSQFGLKCHVKKCHPNLDGQRIECPFCGKVFASQRSLRCHFTKSHPNKSIPEDDTEENSNSIRCNCCRKLFTNELNLRRHVKKYHPSEASLLGPEKIEEGSERVECRICKNVYSNQRNLRCHIKKCHSEDSTQDDQGKSDSAKCSRCTDVFNDQFGLNNHIESCHSGESVTENHRATTEEDTVAIKCSCGKDVYTDGSNSHPNEPADKAKMEDDCQRIQCSCCKKIFDNRINLRRHIKKYHPNEKTLGEEAKVDESIKCTCCKKVYSDELNLRRHIKKYHPSEADCARMECAVCKKVYNNRFNFRRHVKKCRPLEDAEKTTTTTNKPQSLRCATCNELFSTRSNLWRHVKTYHPEAVDQVSSLFIYKKRENFLHPCDLCPKNFNRADSLRYHKKKIHCLPEPGHAKPIRYCPMCKFANDSTEKLLAHYRAEHDIDVKCFEKTFACLEEFNQWKKCYQESTSASYILLHTKRTKTCKLIAYKCHRSGMFKSSGEGKRRLKTKGSCKVNGFCPASIKVKVKGDGACDVVVTETHVGHSNSAEHLQLSTEERKHLATRIAANVPFELIIDEMRDGGGVVAGGQKRIHSLTKKDLHNIGRAFNVTPTTIKQANNSISVESWVHQMKDDCVLYYKARDAMSDEHPELKAEDFVLIIMNGSQADQLQRFGHDCVCLDRTHGSNQYEFEMHTLLVVDEMRQGFPCAFLISNRSDETVLKIFFTRVKHRANVVTPNVFMSDMPECFFSAWVQTMGTPQMRLYCIWHVDCAWRKNLVKINSKEKQVSTYKQLRLIMEQPDEFTFQIMLMELVNKISGDADTEEFAVYFKEHYLNNCTSWAFCYRPHAALAANVHLERIHKTIDCVYLQGKKVKRLDKSIHAIMKFLRNNMFDRPPAAGAAAAGAQLKGGKVAGRLREIQQRHRSSAKLETGLIMEVGGGGVWEVPSLSRDTFEIYRVEEVMGQAGQGACDCQLVCQECGGVCVHRYACSCIDSSIRWNMCKHVHLVHRYRTEKGDAAVTGAVAGVQHQVISVQYHDDHDNGTDMHMDSTDDEHHMEAVLGADHDAVDRLEREKESLSGCILDTIRKIDSQAKLSMVRKMWATVAASLEVPEVSHEATYGPGPSKVLVTPVTTTMPQVVQKVDAMPAAATLATLRRPKQHVKPKMETLETQTLYPLETRTVTVPFIAPYGSYYNYS